MENGVLIDLELGCCGNQDLGLLVAELRDLLQEKKRNHEECEHID